MPKKIPLESTVQTRFFKKLEVRLPGAFWLKNDSGYQQGIPDWTVFWGQHWAWLEFKREPPTGPNDFEPNQEEFLSMAHQWSFGACVYPENEQEVLDAICEAFRA